MVLVRFDLPPVIDSPISRLDGRWRLFVIVLALVTASLLRSLVAGGVCLIGTLLLAVLARMDWRWYGQRLAAIVLFVGLFALPLPFVAEDGWRLAVVLVLKALTLYTLTAVLLVAAPLDATLKGAHALRVPGLVIHLAVLSYRYLFVLADELARLRIALRVRGFRNRANPHAYRAVGAATGTLLARGFERAERVEAAMRCRGFDGRFRSLAEFRTRAPDVLTALAAVAFAVGLALLDHSSRS